MKSQKQIALFTVSPMDDPLERFCQLLKVVDRSRPRKYTNKNYPFVLSLELFMYSQANAKRAAVFPPEL